MKLYVNGDSHTAGAEAVSPAAFAEDDGYPELGRRPHPANLAASWGQQLANKLGVELICDAESAASNYRILRTTRSWMRSLYPWESAVAIIQWSTWEREEWLHNGTWYQVNASGTDWVPTELHLRYKEYVASHDFWAKTQEWYKKIWDLHVELLDRKITHLFYNGWSTFSDIPDKRDFGKNYIGPYDRELSYNSVLVNNGFEWVTPNSYHFDAKGHCFWANYVLQYINEHNLVTHNALSTD